MSDSIEFGRTQERPSRALSSDSLSEQGYITPRKSWPRAASPTDLVPAWAGEFKDYDDWVSKATSRLSGTYDPATGREVPAICVDAIGRRCTMGAHMMRARDEGAFPVRFFWDLRPAEVAQQARATPPDRLSAEGAQQITEGDRKPTEPNPQSGAE